MAVGSILTSILNSGGSGYAVGDTGTIVFGSSDATYIIDTVSSGAVATYTITFPGTYYQPDLAATATGGAQPGRGSGFIINILTVKSCCDATHGPLLAIYIDSLGGGGYTDTDVITLDQGGNTTATFSIVFSGGDPLGLSIIDAGDCYAVGSGVPTSGGSGSGLTVNITSISPCGGPSGPRNRFYVAC